MSNTDVAEAIINAQMLTTGSSELNPQVVAQAKRITKGCSPKEAALKAAELLPDPANPRERYLAAFAWSLSGAKHRQQAIKHLTAYLAGELDPSQYTHSSRFIGGRMTTTEEEEKIHRSEQYMALGKAYEGEYILDYALTSYRHAMTLTPFYGHTWVAASSALVKLADLNGARTLLEEATTTPWYSQEDDDLFKRVIDGFLDDVNQKIVQGYVYKPRPRKA